ncbi:MAG: glycosyltransferase family 2 protein [Cyanobacteriota bacterium]
MHSPLVSVVMSVRNGGNKVVESIGSILTQRDIDLELILINDGSDDDTLSILLELVKGDSRIRFLDRPPRGLTESLIEGCAEAKGKFIARQDAFDYSMPERLRIQAFSLEKEPTASLCTSNVRFITEERASIFVQSPPEGNFEQGLSGIIHGSTMFRKSHYTRAGGYRKEFYYAQDVDLWSRLLELGKHIVVPQVLYENCVYPTSISGTRTSEQRKLHAFIVNATRARRTGCSEDIWLKKAERFSQRCRKGLGKKSNPSKGAYFIGSCLSDHDPVLAHKYLQISLKYNPLNLRARFKMWHLT